MKKIYIIILKFNGEKEIKDCLSSLQLIKVPKNWQKRILVVDNSEKSQISKLKVQGYNLDFKTIRNHKNLGFAAGVNRGIKEALKRKAEAVVLLNQDTIVNKDFLFWLLNNPADIVGPVIKFRRKEKWIYDYGGKVNWWLGQAKHIEKFSIFNFQFSIDYISGCCMLIHRRVFEKIGLFDERYFLYFEDLDFCLRAKGVGLKIAVEPKSIIFHKLREGGKKRWRQRWEMVKSNICFINRWISWWKRPFALVYSALKGIKILII